MECKGDVAISAHDGARKTLGMVFHMLLRMFDRYGWIQIEPWFLDMIYENTYFYEKMTVLTRHLMGGGCPDVNISDLVYTYYR